ncbi:membrane protein YdbS with pleckstrin-like domain [Hymenobacter sp. UYAg731]
MLPRFALPIIVLWIIAVVLAFLPTTDFAGMSHHTYTGILFVAALVATVYLFIKGGGK